MAGVADAFDRRGKLDVILDLRQQGIDTYPAMRARSMLVPGHGGKPGVPPKTEAEPGVNKPLSEMTSEEIQAERKKRKAKEAAERSGAVEGVLEGAPGEPGKPAEDSFELPPDPLNR